jgi:ABC-type glutathione transport system ATPase component
MEPVLSLELSIDYRTKPGVLRRASLDIAAGEVVGLVGRSGSGKSTIALAVMGLLQKRKAKIAGHVRFRGRDLLGLAERDLRRIRGREIALVLQAASAALNPNLTLGTQLREAWRAHGSGDWSDAGRCILATLRQLGLDWDAAQLKRYPGEISVGQAQRVLFAMAVMHKPALLIMDEPTSALDCIAQAELLTAIRGLNREMSMSVLYISHDLRSVAAICNRVCMLHDGQIVESGTPREIFQTPEHEFTRALVQAASLPVEQAAEASLAG